MNDLENKNKEASLRLWPPNYLFPQSIWTKYIKYRNRAIF